MEGYGEARTTTVDLNDLLEMVKQRRGSAQKEKEQTKKVTKKSKFGHFPVTTLVIVMLVVALGSMVTVLKAEITSLKSELADLKSIRAQVASLDPKMEIASVETRVDRKLGESVKEQEKMRTDLARIGADIEALKAARAVAASKKGK